MIHAENKSHILEDICFYVTVDNHPHAYLFDCGMARYLAPGDCKNIQAVFITHTHIDHFSNFDTLLRHQLGVNRKITICGPRGLARQVQSRILSYTWNLIRRRSVVYEVRELQDQWMEVYQVYPPRWELKKIEEVRTPERLCFKEAGILVHFAVLDHKIPSIAYLLEEESTVNIGEFPFRPGPWIRELKQAHGDGAADREIAMEDGTSQRAGELFKYLYVKVGGKFGYAMDHLACDANHNKLMELWRGADEVAIEGYFRDCDRGFALRHYHSTVRESGKVARLAGVKKLTLVHHSRRYAKDLKDLLEEGYASFEDREPSYEIQPVARYEDSEVLDE